MENDSEQLNSKVIFKFVYLLAETQTVVSIFLKLLQWNSDKTYLS